MFIKKSNLFISIILFIVIIFIGHCTTVIKGEVISTGKPIGDFNLSPKGCFSGERMRFYGIILTQNENDGGVLTGIIDPIKGKVIKIRIPKSCSQEDPYDCKEIFISKESCSIYKIAIQPTNVIINRIRALDGKLELDCKFPEGGSIKGKVEFEYCY
jgi:hypothetical protein